MIRDERTRVFAFVRVQYFARNECSCSFVFNIFKRSHVRVRSCSRTCALNSNMFVFVQFFEYKKIKDA